RLDVNRDGLVAMSELNRILEQCDGPPPPDPCRILIWFADDFDAVDAGKDGEITTADLEGRVNADGTIVSVNGVARIIAEYDTDNSGGLSPEEAEAGAVFCRPTPPPPADPCAVVRWFAHGFADLDRDHDGELTLEDLSVIA